MKGKEKDSKIISLAVCDSALAFLIEMLNTIFTSLLANVIVKNFFTALHCIQTAY